MKLQGFKINIGDYVLYKWRSSHIVCQIVPYNPIYDDGVKLNITLYARDILIVNGERESIINYWEFEHVVKNNNTTIKILKNYGSKVPEEYVELFI